MTIKEMILIGTPGGTFVQSPLLANVIPLNVKRVGTGYIMIIGSAPGNRQVEYGGGEGKLTFQNAFSGNIADDTGREDIYIRYKY